MLFRGCRTFQWGWTEGARFPGEFTAGVVRLAPHQERRVRQVVAQRVHPYRKDAPAQWYDEYSVYLFNQCVHLFDQFEPDAVLK